MSYQTEDIELRTRFNTVWADRIPVEWPNRAFTPPSPQAPYCRFVITNGDGAQVAFGNGAGNAHRFPGVLYISIFVPLDSGKVVALQRAEEAAAIFKVTTPDGRKTNWCGTNIQCRASTIKDLGKTKDGWYQVNVSIPFVRDELL